MADISGEQGIPDQEAENHNDGSILVRAVSRASGGLLVPWTRGNPQTYSLKASFPVNPATLVWKWYLY